MAASLTHPIFRRFTAAQVLSESRFDLICPVCRAPGHEDGHDPRQCILLAHRAGWMETFSDWEPAARAEAEKARGEARAAAPPAAAPATAPAATQRKCGQCRQPGHTKTKCPQKAAAAAEPAVEPEELKWEKVSAYTSKVALPPGRYYLSDLCYALPDEMYDEIWGKQFNYNSGVYRRSDGAMFVVDNTADGDGGYRGSDGNTYGVDAGVLAITSEKLTDKPHGGTWQELKTPGTFTAEGGVFTLEGGDVYVQINTAGGDDDEDEDN